MIDSTIKNDVQKKATRSILFSESIGNEKKWPYEKEI